MTNDCLAELTGVSKRFGKTVALNGLDLQVRCGELLAVLGLQWVLNNADI